MGGGKSSPTPTPAPPPDYSSMMEFFSQPMEMPAMPSYTPSEPSGPSLAEQQEAQRLAQGAVDRDDAYASYMDAAGSATNYVNAEIAKEQDNAKLLGIDYSITDESKQTQINDYFASIYGEGEQARMDQLFDEFGQPKGFTEFSVTRGDASKYSGESTGEETVVTQSTPNRTNILSDDEEDNLGGSTNILG